LKKIAENPRNIEGLKELSNLAKELGCTSA
jgi:hypothetical protein